MDNVPAFVDSPFEIVAKTPSDKPSLDVAVLTRQMVEGDEMAYRTFYDAYFNRLLRYLLVVTSGDEETTREALQSTFVRVVRHIKVFQAEPAFWSWLTVLARTALADQNRKRRRYFAFLDRFTEYIRVESATGDDGAADARLLAVLDRGIGKLSSQERELVERKYHAHESVRDIAQALQISEKAVESRLVRVRQRLKEILIVELKNEQTD